MQKEARSIEINEVVIDNIPCKIVFFSDMHVTKNNIDFLNKAALIVNKQKPDLVLIGGDFIHNQYSEIFFQDYMSLIDAPKYGVFGNHDYYAYFDDLEFNGNNNSSQKNTKHKKTGVSKIIYQELQKQGVKILRNEYEKIEINNKEIVIFGYDIEENNNIIINNFDESSFIILLMHEPLYDIRSEYNLILAGHTHGGQIVLPFIGSPLKITGKDCFSGKIVKDNGIIYVTKGLGSFPLFDFLELRCNCPPEIVVFSPPEMNL